MARYFTIDQAHEILPEIRGKVAYLMNLRKAISMLKDVKIRYTEHSRDNYMSDIKRNKEFFRLHAEFYTTLEELEKKGCMVKDLDIGLVDFLSQNEGKDILLCWRFGEDKIRFWHGTDEGFESRKPVEMLKKTEV